MTKERGGKRPGTGNRSRVTRGVRVQEAGGRQTGAKKKKSEKKTGAVESRKVHVCRAGGQACVVLLYIVKFPLLHQG